MFDIENMFEIERNVKMPGKGASEFISVMQKMEVGDSFLVNDREISPRLRSNVYAAGGCQIFCVIEFSVSPAIGSRPSKMIAI